MRLLPGMTWSSLKKTPEVFPVWVVIGGGTLLSTLYLARLALFQPEVTFNHSKNVEPYQRYKEKQYKFYDPAFQQVPKSRAPEY